MIRLFVDGVLAGSQAAGGAITPNDDPWILGNTSAGGAGNFPGSLAEVRISDVALYTEDFERPTGVFSADTRTRLLLHLNENAGTTLRDTSRYSQSGTLSAAAWMAGPILTGHDIAPVGDAQNRSTNEDTSLAWHVSATDTDADATLPYLTFLAATAPQHGSLTLNANGTYTYSPAADWYGNDSFTFVAFDGYGYSPAQTASLSVQAVNDQPTMADQDLHVTEDSSPGTAIDTVIASGVELDQTLTFTIVNGNQAGRFSLAPATGALSVAGALNYEAASSYTLTIRVTDNGAPALSTTATVTIQVDDVYEASAAAMRGSTDGPGRISPAARAFLCRPASLRWPTPSMQWSTSGPTDGRLRMSRPSRNCNAARARNLTANWSSG